MPKQTFHSLSLHPSLLPPTLSYAASVARHVTDELQESVSAGRQGGEKRNTKEDIRKNSFSEFSRQRNGPDSTPLGLTGLGRGGLFTLIWPINLGEQMPNKYGTLNKHLSLRVNGLLCIHSSAKTNVTVHTAPAVEDAVAMRLLLTCIAPLR